MSTLVLILHDYPFKWKKATFKYFDNNKKKKINLSPGVMSKKLTCEEKV